MIFSMSVEEVVSGGTVVTGRLERALAVTVKDRAVG